VAALETLAIIAYKQPITKSEIEAIRGVNCDYAVQKLLEKDLVVITGRNEDAVGKPLVYGTSKSFMDYFGINSTADLPKINEVLMEELIQATIVNQDRVREEDSAEVNAIESNASEAPVAEVENVKDEIAGTHHAEVENTEADIAGEENSDEETAVEENTTDETSVNVFEEEGAEGKQDKQKGGQSDDSEA
jgi:segregation and condensation protein B